MAGRVKAGQVGTERDLWRPYFEEVLVGTGAPPDRLERLGEGLRQAHLDAHLWSWAPPEVARTLETLRNRGFRLAAISNADGRMGDAVTHAGLDEHLEFLIDSGAVGVEKPDPAIFEMGCSRLGLPPSECAYVGDIVPVDVEGAAGAGLTPVLVDPADQFTEVEVLRIRSLSGLLDVFPSNHTEGT